MTYDPHDTIVAVASATGGAARGVVRISGPQSAACVAACFSPDASTANSSSPGSPSRTAGSLRIDGDELNPAMLVPGELILWPGTRSYTRQPAAEFHTLGSPPLLSAVVEQLCRCGARPAAAGEFTLRAFLAGRIDLVQAEAVLGVIDASWPAELDGALDQLAGGLSRPLHRLREQLLNVLAELEAGLDFVDEDIEFIGHDQLRRRLAEGRAVVAATLAQIIARDRRTEAPRLVLAGAPNAGKSSLFNALVQRYGTGASSRAIVSPIPGATRDYLVARLELDGVTCELIDAAGEGATQDVVGQMSQDAAAVQRRSADIRVQCVDVSSAAGACGQSASPGDFLVFTKIDLEISKNLSCATGSANAEAGLACSRGALAEPVAHEQDSVVRCSSVKGDGIAELGDRFRQRLVELSGEHGGGGTAATAARCVGSLQQAGQALASADDLVATGAGHELVAAEIRAALDDLGEVVGAVCVDDVLDRIFSQFCIGK